MISWIKNIVASIGDGLTGGKVTARRLDYQRIMMIVSDSAGRAYGVSIRSNMEERYDRKISVARSYWVLSELEDDGMIVSKSNAGRGGRLSYTITPKGAEFLAEMRRKAQERLNDKRNASASVE